MSLGDLYQGEVDQAVDASIKLASPVKPEVPRKWNGWSAPLRALPAFAAESLAGTAELVTGVARRMDYERRTPFKPGQMIDPNAPEFDGTSDVSESLRAAAEFYRPDPATASLAERLVFDFTRIGGKAITYGLTLGPGAIPALAADEGLTTTDELQKKGVDKDTARKAGIVTALGVGVSAGIPVVGSTLGKTAALAAVSGPATYVAQTAMTRDILAKADYDLLSRQYDPLDPTGLALSFVAPFTLGALLRKGGAKPPDRPTASDRPADGVVAPETVDAALTHNLTLIRDNHEARTPAIEAEAGRPVESLAAFTERSGFKATPAEPAAGPDFLAWIKRNGGVDLGEKETITGERGGIRANPGGIFRKGGTTTDDLASRAALEGYLRPDQEHDSAAFVDLLKRAVAGDKVLTFDQQMREAARAHSEAEIAQKVDILERRLQLLGVDPAEAKGSVEAMAKYLREHEEALIQAEVERVAAEQRAAELPERERKPEPEQVERARTAAQDLRDSGKPIEEFVADAKLPADVQNLLVGLHEARGDEVKQQRMLNDFARTVEQQPGRSPVDISADVVEAGRKGQTVTPEPAPPAEAAPASPEQATANSIAARVAEVEATAPDLPVGQDANGRPVTAAELMAQARKEAAEGTADELGTRDVELLQIAADCAMQTGDL